jgi:RNA polymerase sigma factor (sigma-70 family)
MKDHFLHAALRRLSRSVETTLADDQLLERFAAGGDEAAFAALVDRHGRMVWSVCRRLLRREHDAEDAFQATFLILVRRARSIGRGEALAGWLYRVAYRVALRARAQAARQAARERQASRPAEGVGQSPWPDLRPVLDEEVGRLPEKYRLPVVLCYLSGQTTEEAARRLGCPRGTVLSRLAWARKRLRGRLEQRGLAVSVGALAALVADKAPAAPPRNLAWSTVRAATWLAASHTTAPGAISEGAVALMEGVLRAMYWTRMRTITAVVTLGLIGAAAGFWAYRPAEAGALAPAKDEAAPSHAAAALPARVTTLGLAGTWVREAGPHRLTLRFEGDRLHGTIVGPFDGDQGERATAFLDADFSVSRDGTVYGLVTSVEGPDGDANGPDEFMGMVDEPFSARVRVDEDMLIIKDVKFRTGTNNPGDQLRPLLGRYKKMPAGYKAATDENQPRTDRARRPARQGRPALPALAPATVVPMVPAPGNPASPAPAVQG